MAWDVQTAREITGAAAATPDAALVRAMDVVLALVQRLLARGLFKQRETSRFYNVSSPRIYLRRYPIETVHSVNGVPLSGCSIIHHCDGWIQVKNVSATCCTLEVDYTGGYDVLPPDLEAALWEIFLFYWDQLDPLTGLMRPGGGGAAAAGGTGEVSRVTLADFGTVSFDVGGSSGSSGDSFGRAGPGSYWGWLEPWASVLQTYRNMSNWLG